MEFMRKCRVALLAAAMVTAAGAAVAAEPAPANPEIERQLGEARERLAEAAREVGELSQQLGRQVGDRLLMRLGGPPARAVLGVQIQPEKGGSRVVAVSPGGAAEAAGIRQGDLITAVGGTDLSTLEEPNRVLMERVRDLQPGLKVKVGLLRDGRKMEVDVTPREPPAMAMRGLPPLPPMGPGSQPMRVMGLVRDGGQVFRGMEFATLSENLGKYFGVKSGVLVVRAGESSVIRLGDGDVILAIDGREPTSAAHATRILRSYQPGEKVSLRVQRDRRVLNLDFTLPAGDERRPMRRN